MNKKMIVICDDNAPLAVLMQHLLRKEGYNVRVAADGREGLALVRSASPDLLLLDLAMPGIDGLAVLEQLRVAEGKKPYTIVISGQAGTEARERALSFGANEVWEKPFNAAALKSRIEALIAQGTF